MESRCAGDDGLTPPSATAESRAGVPAGRARVALITGISGQDGSYLAELLLSMPNYEVHGIVRRTSTVEKPRLDHLRGHPRLHLHYGDLTDALSLWNIVKRVQPDEVYNLGAQSHVMVSFENPVYTQEADCGGALKLLQVLLQSGMVERGVRFYQASSSELYGDALEVPQNESTPFNPVSPYAIAKHGAFLYVRMFRRTYGMHASNGILFNHESPRRAQTFVTRKITKNVARIAWQLREAGPSATVEPLTLGNLYSERDWGFAGDYVRAMWLMLQQDTAADYVVATGRKSTVKQFVEMAFSEAGLPALHWEGKGEDEHAWLQPAGGAAERVVVVRVDRRYYRPSEVDLLLGDATLARVRLGWEPSVDLRGLVRMMVRSDLAQQETSPSGL